MAKKRRPTAFRSEGSPARTAPTPPAAAPPASAAAPPASAAQALPAEAGRGDLTVAILALMMFLAPALGVPHEEMLQDTLKSIIVSFAALAAALLFFFEQRARADGLRWHAILFLPLLLMAYALGSMAWSHTYLGGVEAIRWFIFSLLLWLGLNTLSRERFTLLAWGIHAGAVAAALWAALQFWFDLRLFPQGPNPASTFINRNFFAEFVVCTLPFTAFLLARARQSGQVALLSMSGAFVLVTILMTGTRAALIALWLQLLVVLPLVAWRCRASFEFARWKPGVRFMAAGILLGTVAGLGLIPSGNPKILEEGKGATALERAFVRTQSIRRDDASLNIRMIMWRATLNVIEARPVTGVGAGAWESEIPLYQEEGAQLETDYYVHNEFLQLVAEYGLVGWAFLIGLIGYLLTAAWRTWNARTPEEQSEAALRGILLTSLLALMIVSNIGFPWRMAATGTLFSLCLAGLAASDARLSLVARMGARRLPWKRAYAQAALAATLVCIGLALFITKRAAESESKIVKAAKIAITISGSGMSNDPRWAPAKKEMLELIREGVALNRHYRKITPLVADELANWGDWRNAVWIWESVLSSRPNIVAIITNTARGYTALGDYQKARAYLDRAKRIQPRAPAVHSLEVILLSRTGQDEKALALAKEAIAAKVYDFDLVSAAFVLGWRAGDFAFATRAMALRMEHWPESRARGHVQLGNMYARGLKDPDRAVASFKQALELARDEQERKALLQQIDAEYLPKLGQSAAPSARAGY